MAKYFATAFFEQGSKGWTETYYRDAVDITDLAALADFDRVNIWTDRAKAMGEQTTIVAQRVSFDNVAGDSVINYIPIVGNSNWKSEDANTALLVRLGNVPNVKRKNVFMRGIPDDLVINGGEVDRGFAAWKAAADTFFLNLIRLQYGWRSIVLNTPIPVTGYVTNAEKQVVFTVGDGLPVQAAGTKIVLRGQNMGVGKPSVLNNSLPCIWVDANTVKTTKAIAVFPFPGVGGFLVKKDYDLIRASNHRYQKIDSRKAGKASHVQAGRSRAKPRG